jgi:hypothetical protein
MNYRKMLGMFLKHGACIQECGLRDVQKLENIRVGNTWSILSIVNIKTWYFKDFMNRCFYSCYSPHIFNLLIIPFLE